MASRTATAVEEYATDGEVVAAIDALTTAETLRLSKVASFRARGLAAFGLGTSADDLLQEAIARTLNGTRRWRKTVNFVTHLTQTIRSIANHAREELKGGTVAPATSDDADGKLDGIAVWSVAPDPERAAAAVEQLDKISESFESDPEVGLILTCLARGMTGPEIHADLGITQTQYETIMTRLRRGVDRREGWRP